MKKTIPVPPETLTIGESKYPRRSAHLPHLGDDHDHKVLRALESLRPKSKKVA